MLSTKKREQMELVDNLLKSSRRILVVDDEQAIRDALLDMLSFMGHKAVAASNGIEALNLFLRSSFDLVLTDYQMFGMDGLALAFHIKKRSADTPVVLITGESKEGIMEKLKGKNVDFVLFKPFRLEEIQETVERLLEHGTSEREISNYQ